MVDLKNYLDIKLEPENRSELFYLFKWLFQEIMILMNSSENQYYLGSDDLTKYLNSQILNKCPDLRNYLKDKINTANKSPNQINELLIRKLQEDESINFEALLNEQMDCFYHLQPS